MQDQLYNILNKLIVKNNDEIVLDNPNATIELVIVTGPFCYYSKKAHSDIENLLKQGRNEIKIIIRFNASIENKDDDIFKIAALLINIYNIEGEAVEMRRITLD